MNYIEVDRRSKFAKWDAKVELWYLNLCDEKRLLSRLIFPFIFIGDVLMIIPRWIDEKRTERKYRHEIQKR